jgi:hypothetical protein
MARELPKSAHRNALQKAQGYFGAAHRALVSARFFIPDETDWADIVDDLVGQIEAIPDQPGESRSSTGRRPEFMLRMSQRNIDRLEKAAR